MKLKFVSLILGIMVLSGLAAIYGAGFSYDGFITPRNFAGGLSGIGADGWIQDGATINLDNLAGRGNQLILTLKGYRPRGLEPALYEISVCGRPAASFQDDGRSTKVVHLTGVCDPREVKFNVKNPFHIGGDSRSLGTQLQSAKLRSLFGVPLISVDLLFRIAAAIAALSFLLLLLLLRSGHLYFSFLIALIATVLLANADKFQIEKLFPLWLLFMVLLLGLALIPVLGERLIVKDFAFARKFFHSSETSFWAVTAILVIAAGLRFYGISFGLPENYHPDEVPKVNAIMRMVETNSLNPNYFLHPSLLLYCTYFMNLLLRFFGLAGDFRETAFLAGRVVSAIAGTVSVYFTYVIGKQLFSERNGILGSILLAVFPLHITCSRYLKEDALLLFFILASVVALLKALTEDKRGFIYVAAFLAGSSASVKYSGILAIGIVCLAPWLRSRSLKPDPEFFKTLCGAVFLAPLAFVLCSPYTVINYDRFFKDFASEHHHMMRGHLVPISAWSQYWMYHFTRSILPGMTLIPTLLSLMGVSILLWRRRIDDLFPIFIILLFYLPAEWVKAKPAPQPERYILPCLPFLAICAGEFLKTLSDSRFKITAAIVTFLAVFFPVLRSALLASEITHDTRAISAGWIRTHLPHGSRIYLDWKRYAPSLSQKDFKITFIKRAEILQYLNVKSLRESGKDYLALSSLFYDRYFTDPNTPAGPRNIFRTLFEQVPIVAEFRSRYGSYGFHNPVMTIFSLKPKDFDMLNKELALQREGLLDKTINEKRSSMYWRERKSWIFSEFEGLF